ncbi:unnamed protein product [Paramecium sonneborni]|uniref:Uncharacterized protein n=1 Tax=Paramecium sonneborni TaxID=65129 RepID=A0A8S1K296_9CILI|nr:unnamed protein product [Paramecium sonneborni]
MQQVCSNFLADPSDTSFGFQIKCKNCQFTRKQHIQNNNVKPKQDVNEIKTITSNSKLQDKLVNVVGNAFQNPKMQESMKEPQNQQKAVTTIEQIVFQKATSINEKQNEKNETDMSIDNQIQFERQNVRIYNSDKALINQSPKNQEKNQNEKVLEEENQKGLSQKPSFQQDSNFNQKVEQIQNNKNELEEVKPNKLQSNQFIKQDQNTSQKVEQQSNSDTIKTKITEVQQPKKLQSNPFIQKNQEQQQNQTAVQGNPIEEQKIKKLSQNQFMKIDQNFPLKVEQKCFNNQVTTFKPQVQVVVNDQKDPQQTEKQQKQHQIQNQQQINPQNNLKLPQDNSNSNQLSNPQSVKEKAKSMQFFGFGVPPPNKPPQDPYQEKPQIQFLLDRPILLQKKHNRSQQNFQDTQN